MNLPLNENFSFKSVSSIHGKNTLSLTLDVYLSTSSSEPDNFCVIKSFPAYLLSDLIVIDCCWSCSSNVRMEWLDRIEDVEDARCRPPKLLFLRPYALSFLTAYKPKKKGEGGRVFSYIE